METSLSVKQVVGDSWEILKREKKFLLLYGLFLFVGSMLLNGVKEGITNQGWGGAQFGWSIVSWILQVYTGLMTLQLSLKVVRKKPLVVKELIIKDMGLLWHYILISLWYGLVVFGGIVLLIVPGIIWGMMYSLAPYLVVDRGMGIKEAMAESKRFTKGNKGKLFLIGLTFVGINILGALLLGVGVIVTAPLSLVAGGLVYEQLTSKNNVSVPLTPAQKKPKADSDMSQYQI